MVEPNNDEANPGTPVVLGGGGMLGPGLLGLLDYLRDEQVVVSDYLGVSIGSVVAALHTNGVSTDEIAKLFEQDLSNLTLQDIGKLILPPLFNPLRLLTGGLIDLEPVMRKLVAKYNLTPRANLRIVAYDMLRGKPVVFSGTDYDLAKALAASCTIPALMRPIEYQAQGQTRYLTDGGLFHPHPGSFHDQPAIIGALSTHSFLGTRYKLHPKDFVANLNHPAAWTFGPISAGKVSRYRQFGYERAKAVLHPHVLAGRIQTSVNNQ